MTTEKLTKLELKIRELVPRLRELSFGCRFLEKGFSPRELVYLSKFTETKCVAYWSQAGYGEALSATVGTIIGHPITLDAVLEAVGHEYACNGNGNILSHMGDNERGWQTTGCPKCFLLSEWCECEPQFEVKWRLGKPWEEQEQVHKFLFNLFFNDSR